MSPDQTLVVNLFGGPGTGKSTIMADLFARLKWAGYNVEMAPEFAKEKVWEESIGLLSNQVYIFGKQHQTIHRLKGKVQIILTDSPLLLSLHYGSYKDKEFHDLVLAENRINNNLNIFLRRTKPFNPAGRLQNEQKAKVIDDQLRIMLKRTKQDHIEFDASQDRVPVIYQEVVKRYVDDTKRQDNSGRNKGNDR